MTASPTEAPAAVPSRISRSTIGFLVVDLACIAAFVGLGRETHGVTRGVGWFFNVWWPLAVGWIVGMLVTRLYGTSAQWPLRLVATVAIAVAVGGPLRTLMDRPIYSVFTAVAFGFLCLATFGWRLLLLAYRGARA